MLLVWQLDGAGFGFADVVLHEQEVVLRDQFLHEFILN